MEKVNISKKMLETKSRGELRITNQQINEFKRANEMTSTLGSTYGHVQTAIYVDGYPRQSFATKLKINILDLQNNGLTEIPFSNGAMGVQVLSEGESYVDDSTIERIKGTLEPVRYQAVEYYTQEYVASSLAQDLLLSDALFALENAAVKELLEYAATLNVATGHTSTDYKNIMLEVDNKQGMFAPAFVQNSADFLTGIETFSGSTNVFNSYDYMSGRVYGAPIYGTDFISSGTTIFADFGKAFIGWFGDIRIIFDYVSNADTGKVKVTYQRMGDVTISPYAVVSVSV